MGPDNSAPVQAVELLTQCTHPQHLKISYLQSSLEKTEQSRERVKEDRQFVRTVGLQKTRAKEVENVKIASGEQVKDVESER